MPDALHQPVRRDVARNRARLLSAASRLFSVRTDVTLTDVAREADVGVGTVYRHFPTLDDLIDALGSERLGEAVQIARTAAADPDGWRGLTRFLEESLALQAQNGWLRALVKTGECENEQMDQAREDIAPLIEQMTARARAQGSLRPDVEACDITLVQLALLAVLDATRDTSPDRYRQHLAFLLAGIRADGPGVRSTL
ncbi:TetR/AcrR family transcriptional regulator [Streptomyces sp. NPDC014892]|uniref:TetR/AcrR family transcriptional regulator n=1 Tax=Streptomyces TaxID=1883 RepID=UPI001EFABE45|nr:TetR/AcrR family transcriptional regulator [Streptomyces deccanensis]ULR52510.1 TetR/AcrR family transcriptional regulator [Streptomyces deccanensis]